MEGVRKTPSTNIQAPEKRQAPSAKRAEEIARLSARRSPMEQARAVRDWNNKVSASGAAVAVLLDDGSVKETVTRSEAWLMGGHSAVVMVEGISGAYSLHRVKAKERP